MSREFPDKPRPRDTHGDPALDPPCTIRVQGGEDRRTRLFDPNALRAVRTTSVAEPWLVVAGPDSGTWSPYEVGDVLTHDDVRNWTVVPALFVTVPWSRSAGHVPDEGALAPAERGDLDVEAFRG